MQNYKGDAKELKFEAAFAGILTQIYGQRTDLFEEAYNCYILGEVLYDSERSPLANAIPRAIFRESFATVFDAFTAPGSFEGYITVFQNIFGATVDIVFTVPAPGKLQIDITAAGIEYKTFNARRIVSNAYVLEPVVTYLGDNIVFKSVKGFESQYELEQMLFEMVPAGIYTEITLSF